MKLSSHHKKQRSMRIDTLTSKIANLEGLNKANPQPTHSAQLLSLRQELRLHLLHSNENTQRKLRATSYSTSNKAGKVSKVEELKII